jgi:RNA polymerase sigma factor (sigma-70 family)
VTVSAPSPTDPGWHEEWLEALCRREHPKILRRCQSLLLNEQDAQDACQETYARAVLHRDKLQAAEHPGGWLMGTARRVCYESLRRRWQWTATRRYDGGADTAPLDEDGAEWWRRHEAAEAVVPRAEMLARHELACEEDAWERAERLAELRDLADRLSPALAEVARLTLDGWYPREIADELAITEGTVHTRISRVRDQLAELMERQRQHEAGAKHG